MILGCGDGMPQKKAKSVRRRKPQNEYCTYMIEVMDWDARYSFSVNRDRTRTPGPYSEYSSIEIKGKLLLPEKHAGTEIECTVYGKREYDEYIWKPVQSDRIESGSVGMINIRKDYSHMFGWVPFTAFPMVANLLATGDFRYLQLFGTILKYRTASVVSLDFRKDFDPEDCI